MQPKLASGCLVPPVRYGRLTVRVQRIEHAIVGLRPLADDEQANLILGSVDEGMCKTRAGGEADRISRSQPMKPAVRPGVGCALEEVDELLVCTFRMGKGQTASGCEALVVDADPLETEVTAEVGADGSSWPGYTQASLASISVQWTIAGWRSVTFRLQGSDVIPVA
jgi:hypothetical protein